MKKRLLTALLILVLCVGLAACGGESAPAENSAAAAATAAPAGKAEPPADALDAIEAGYFSKRDFDSRYSEVGTPTITFKGDSAESSTNMVEIEGGTVRIKLEGTYIISGRADDGCIIVDADKTQKIQLVLKNADINSLSSAPIYVKEADKVFITLAEGSVNSLSNGGEFSFAEDSKIDAAIFARDDLTINGGGSLSISSPAGHGIKSNDSLSITGGSFDISCAGKGISANDDVTVGGGSFAINSGKDGIQAQHDTNPEKGFVYILDGDFDIKALGDGISAGTWIKVDGGKFRIDAADDALLAQTDVTVNAGEFALSFADEAVSAKGSISVNGGNINDYAGSFKTESCEVG